MATIPVGKKIPLVDAVTKEFSSDVMEAIAADTAEQIATTGTPANGATNALIDAALAAYTPGTPIAYALFGTTVGYPRPDATVVIWVGDPSDPVVPTAVEDMDMVVYPTTEDVVPAWELTDVTGLTFDFNAETLVGAIADGATVSTHWQDSVSGRLLTAVSANAATLDEDGFNGGPCVVWPSSTVLRTTVPFSDYTGAWTVFALVKHTSGNGLFMDATDQTDTVLQLAAGATSGSWRIQRSTALVDGTVDTGYHLFEGVYNGSSSSVAVDSATPTTGSTTALRGFKNLAIGGRADAASGLWVGRVARIIGIQGLVSSTNRTNIRDMLIDQGGL